MGRVHGRRVEEGSLRFLFYAAQGLSGRYPHAQLRLPVPRGTNPFPREWKERARSGILPFGRMLLLERTGVGQARRIGNSRTYLRAYVGSGCHREQMTEAPGRQLSATALLPALTKDKGPRSAGVHACYIGQYLLC